MYYFDYFLKLRLQTGLQRKNFSPASPPPAHPPQGENFFHFDALVHVLVGIASGQNLCCCPNPTSLSQFIFSPTFCIARLMNKMMNTVCSVVDYNRLGKNEVVRVAREGSEITGVVMCYYFSRLHHLAAKWDPYHYVSSGIVHGWIDLNYIAGNNVTIDDAKLEHIIS